MPVVQSDGISLVAVLDRHFHTLEIGARRRTTLADRQHRPGKAKSAESATEVMVDGANEIYIERGGVL